jgi:hypothetical protein
VRIILSLWVCVFDYQYLLLSFEQNPLSERMVTTASEHRLSPSAEVSSNLFHFKLISQP